MPSLMIGTCILLSHLSYVITSLPESRIAIMLWNQTLEHFLEAVFIILKQSRWIFEFSKNYFGVLTKNSIKK